MNFLSHRARMASKNNLKLVIVLALIAGLGPISIHVIVPVLP